jgi:NAD(P)-dependent dehydrogenase (short-subunit alcohol dehydrogenase family)
MEIAVTGGLGRLGRYVVRELAQHTVRVLDIGAPAECHPADLRDLDALRAGLRGVEVVGRRLRFVRWPLLGSHIARLRCSISGSTCTMRR